MTSPTERGSNSQPEVLAGLTRREREFPRDIDRRRESIFSAFNAAPKAVVQLLLRDYMIDTHSLDRLFRGSVIGSQLSVIRDDAASSYCEDSLCKVGLVAEEVTMDYFGEEKLIGFVTTQEGEKYGKPAAALFLLFENAHNMSMYPVFGQSGLRADAIQRAPLTRSKILKLLRKGPLREVDICSELNISHQMARDNLVALRSAGAVNYEFGRTEYFAIPGAGGSTRLFRGYRTLEDEIMSICGNFPLESPITPDGVYQRLSDEAMVGRSEPFVRQRISSTLSSASSQGLLRRGKFRGTEVLSNAELTDKGELIVDELIDILEDALNDGPSLDRLRNIQARVQANLGRYAVTACDLYYPHSRSHQMRDRINRQGRVRELLMEAADGITVQEVSSSLGIGELTSRRDLMVFVQDGQAERRKVKGKYHFFPLAQPGRVLDFNDSFA